MAIPPVPLPHLPSPPIQSPLPAYPTDNQDWFDMFLERQKELAEERMALRLKEMRKKQFKHVFQSEFKIPKPTK